MLKSLTVWIKANCRKFLKRWEYQITLPVPWENEGQKQQLELDMEQRTGSKLGKDYFKAVYCYPAYLTSIVHHAKCPAGRITSWNKDCQDKYQQPQISRWYHSNGRKKRGTKKPLDEAERRKWKISLKSQYSKNKDHGIWYHHFMASRWGEKWKQWLTLLSWAPKSLCMVPSAMKLKDASTLEGKLW